jgi:hypothetical protein
MPARMMWCGAVWAGLAAIGVMARAQAAEGPDFDREVRPILFARCVKCHGADKPEAGLRLNARDATVGVLESGRRAVTPGNPRESELLRRVTAADADERMPPQGESLSVAEVETLKQWIAAGAEWPAHWAYRPLSQPAVPAGESSDWQGWPRTPIDRFLLERLLPQQMTPSPDADRRTLLRRVSLDLIGLPPTPDELEAFLSDASPEAYERVVDRLLASPHYGERQARIWMDLVHYAETHGHDQDRPREHAWPYRDYLIRAFNEDRPYARFVQEQVAGDALFPDDATAIVATGFLAAGPWDESSLQSIQPDSIDRLIGQTLDRDDVVSTVMNTFVSTTVQCARCHDHKFDPVSQREYYALQAVFAGADKATRAYDVDPQVAVRRRQLTEQLAQLTERAARSDPWLLQPDLQARAAAWEQQRTPSTRWQVLQPNDYSATMGTMLVPQADGSLLATGPRPETDTYLVTAAATLRSITGVRLEVLTDEGLPQRGPGRQDNGNLHLNELVVSLAPADAPAQFTRLKLTNPVADFDQQDWTVAHAVDGNPATAWGIHPQVGKSHEAWFEVLDAPPRDAGGVLKFELQQAHGRHHLIGRLRLSVTETPPPFTKSLLPAEITAVLEMPATERTVAQRMQLAAYVERQRLDALVAALPKPALVYCGSNQFTADGSFQPAVTPRPVHLLRRGDIQQPGELVGPGALACLPELPGQFALANPDHEGERRAALARWLTDSQNVLTWRSMANRVWQQHFGRGLVSTPSDFGRMGAAPTHPELLDWLAVELRDHAGSLKHLHRLIVISRAYQQASQYDSPYAAVDAGNHFLWRMNRRRLDAEAIRDSLLVIADNLNSTMGGPSVKQFAQSPGVQITPTVDYFNFPVDDPAHARRSVYRFVFRTLPDPFLETFDCPDSSQLAPQRNESVSALQALALLHDQTVVRQSERIAQRVLREVATSSEQVAALYRLVLGRGPTDAETRIVSEYAQQHGLANACRFLLNSNEFLFVE